MGYEIDFLPVGKSSGDAILVRYGDDATGYRVNLIDGAYSDTAQRVIDHIKTYYGGLPIGHMVLSHADDDHATGLIDVLKNCVVHNLWMNRPWRYAADVVEHFHGNYTVDGLTRRMKELHPYLVELEDIAFKRRIPVHEAFQGNQIGPFTVLAPSRDRYISLIPELDKTPDSYSSAQPRSNPFGMIADAVKSAAEWIAESWNVETLGNDLSTSASNETSLVQLGRFGDRTALLTADVGPVGLEEAARYAATLGMLSPPDFVQVPHHGSRHNISKRTLTWWLGEPVADASIKRGTAFCSIGSGDGADKYPRKVVSNAFLRRGYPVHVTKGSSKRHHIDMAGRNWTASEPIPFANSVEN